MTRRFSTTQLVTLGAAGAVLTAFLLRKQIAVIGGQLVPAAQLPLFSAVIPADAARYASVILRVANEESVDPFVLVALGERESHWGQTLVPQGPAGTGDYGHGYGLMQIDDRSNAAWLASNDWSDPYTNVKKGAQILKQKLSYLASHGLTGDDLQIAALAAYNAGEARVAAAYAAGGIDAVDAVTTGSDYSGSVSAMAASLAASFHASAGAQA